MVRVFTLFAQPCLPEICSFKLFVFLAFPIWNEPSFFYWPPNLFWGRASFIQSLHDLQFQSFGKKWNENCSKYIVSFLPLRSQLFPGKGWVDFLWIFLFLNLPNFPNLSLFSGLFKTCKFKRNYHYYLLIILADYFVNTFVI